MLKFDRYLTKEHTVKAKTKDAIKDAIKEEMRSDRVGYYKLPKQSLKHIKTLEKLDLTNVSQIVVLGVGGSSLGIKAINQLLKHTDKNIKEMIFLENSDPITITENINKIDINRALFFVISKSGSTIETTSILKTVIEFFKLDLLGDDSKKIIAITELNSPLSIFAKKNGILEFSISSNVGGRFSVLSAVGIAPLYTAGYDVRAILEAAEEFLQNFLDGKESHLIEKAIYLHENAKSTPTSVLFSYSDRLENFTKWFIQLWAESLGKIDKNRNNVGLTPIGLTGALDQHSFLQLIMEGPRDKFVTFIKIDDFQNTISIPDISLSGIENTDFINTKSYNTLINSQCDSTMQSLISAKINTDIITLDSISAKNIGALIMYYEILTSALGIMFNVDAYNQPGVELSKQILYENIQKS